jgi:NADH-quinone oxidoreductase subunit G
MATIFIEGKPYEVKDGQNLLEACLSLGFNLPYFCWHPALGSVGACRQCAVKQFRDENDTQGKIVMACLTPATNGTRISIDDAEVRLFRATVIEWLMVNHPHDCPICDEGGECHLQDMTVLTGHAYREFRFNKRTHRNQYLGPFVNHEMNRCIACYRCVRFYRDYAHGRDFDVFAAHNYVYFGRHQEGVLESEFSGNLVEVCPTGVFTDKTLKKHYTRKWDLQTAPSVCVHCGLGCNTIPGERYGLLRRIRNRYNSQVNGYFLCDRGRYGYEFVNSEQRIRKPLLRNSLYELPQPIIPIQALEQVTAALADRERVIGIGSPRASLEANFALRTLVGPERFYQGLSTIESRLVALALRILREGPARSASLHDAQMADAVLVLGEDVTNTAPMLALALRQSVLRQPMARVRQLHLPEWNDAAVREVIQKNIGPLYIATPYGTKLDDVARRTYQAAPANLARLGFAIAHALDGAAPAVDGLPEEVRSLAQEIAGVLKGAERPLIVSGSSCGSEAVTEAAANVARALAAGGHEAQISLVLPECNSLGLGLIGGKGLHEAFRLMQNGAADTVIILENDLYRRADAALVHSFLEIARHVIVLDHLANQTLARAEIVLPVATFADADGTLVNSEGRAQRFYRVLPPQDQVRESWCWLRDIMAAAGRSPAQPWQTIDDVSAAMAAALPALEAVRDIVPPAGFRLVGQKIPRQTHRATGRTAMHANVDVHEPRPPDDPDSPLSFSMEGYEGQPPSALIPRFWAPHWNSVQALNKFQEEIAGPLRGGDPGRRLIEPAQGAGDRLPGGRYFDRIPASFEPQAGQWLMIPIHHIFGSEELSILTPGIGELAPEPYLGLHPEDAAGLGAEAGEEVALHMEDVIYRLPLKLMPTLPRGIAGLPAGLPGLPGITRPEKGVKIER